MSRDKKYIELEFLKYNFEKNRKAHHKIQMRKLNNYLAATSAYLNYSRKIIKMIDNPYAKLDPEAILLNLKDYIEKTFKISLEEKTKAKTELMGLKRVGQNKDDIQEDQTEENFNVFDIR